MTKFNTALIGCGRIGFLLEYDPLRYKPCTHYGGASSAGIPINYACDINSSRLKKFSQISGIPLENTYTEYRNLISEVRPEMVIIATWTDSHSEIGIFAAKNGAQVIICEKPISHDLKEAKKLVNICEKNNVILIINHERRYESRYRTVKKILDNKIIGDIKTIYASILSSGFAGHGDVESGGGTLLHDGTHLIDIIRFFFGDIKSLEGEFQRKGRTSGFEDRATAWLKTTGNIDIFLESGGNREYFVFELQISGTKGKIVIGNGYEHLFINKKSKFYSGFKDITEKPFPRTGMLNCFKREYLEAKTLMLNKSNEVTSKGIDGYKALEAVHAVYLSSYLNKKNIELPLNPGRIDIKKIFNI